MTIPVISGRTRYVIGLVIGAHGAVYLAGTLLNPGLFDIWKGTSLLLGGVITGDPLKTLWAGLSVTAGLGLILTSSAIVLTTRFPGLWRPLALGAALVAILSFAVFWDGQVSQLVNEGVVGLGLSAVILVGSAAFPKTFG